MKQIVFFIAFLFVSCTSLYHKVDLTKLQDIKADTNISLLYGTYSFETNFCFLRGRIGLNIQKEGKISPHTYFAFEDESGDFIFVLEPGNYKIVSVDYYSESTYEVYDSQSVNYPFEAISGKILYLGNFTPIISFDVEYIYWGISDVKNNSEIDRNHFIKKFSGFENFDFKEAVPEKLGRVKKLKYCPGSPNTNI
ncbi:MAG: hypothetical protein ACP5QT_01645 [Brevinematia bacterium]